MKMDKRERVDQMVERVSKMLEGMEGGEGVKVRGDYDRMTVDMYTGSGIYMMSVEALEASKDPEASVRECLSGLRFWER